MPLMNHCHPNISQTNLYKKMTKKIVFSLMLTLVAALFYSCSEKGEKVYSGKSFVLTDMNKKSITYPDITKGKITVVGYIFTNCPDICPLTTNNMRLLKEKFPRRDYPEIEFVSISFDPKVDTPEVLKKFAEVRDLDLNGWTFLTGEPAIISDLMHEAGIISIPGDSTVTPAGEKIIFYIHTDRISVIDRDGILVQNFPGSSLDIDKAYREIIRIY